MSFRPERSEVEKSRSPLPRRSELSIQKNDEVIHPPLFIFKFSFFSFQLFPAAADNSEF